MVLLGALSTGLVAACAASDGVVSTGDVAAAAVPGYQTVVDMPVPGGGASRWEYQVLDAQAERLYLADSGAGRVVVVDLAQERVAATVPGIASAHGLALAAGPGRLYASVTAKDEVAVIDLSSDRVIARAAAGSGPDSLAYVSSSGRLFVSDAGGTAVTVIDVESNLARSAVELGDGVGNGQYDPWSGWVLVAAAGRHELVALDPSSAAVVARYPLPGCDGAQGVQVDVSGQDRVFVACEGNARLLGVDLHTGAVSAPLEVGAGPDILALDPTLHRLYVASASGVLTVVDTSRPDLAALARGYVGPDAHSVAVDPNTHLVYLPLAGVRGRSVVRVLAPQ
jgi:DNA-binding beta-propeller fold protein YncE